jgi:hypothetical protein
MQLAAHMQRICNAVGRKDVQRVSTRKTMQPTHGSNVQVRLHTSRDAELAHNEVIPAGESEGCCVRINARTLALGQRNVPTYMSYNMYMYCKRKLERAPRAQLGKYCITANCNLITR